LQSAGQNAQGIIFEDHVDDIVRYMISAEWPLQNLGIVLKTLMLGFTTHMQQSWESIPSCKAKVGLGWRFLVVVGLKLNLDDLGLLANLNPNHRTNLEQQLREQGESISMLGL